MNVSMSASNAFCKESVSIAQSINPSDYLRTCEALNKVAHTLVCVEYVEVGAQALEHRSHLLATLISQHCVGDIRARYRHCACIFTFTCLEINEERKQTALLTAVLSKARKVDLVDESGELGRNLHLISERVLLLGDDRCRCRRCCCRRRCDSRCSSCRRAPANNV